MGFAEILEKEREEDEGRKEARSHELLAIFQGISWPSDRNERPLLASFLLHPPQSVFSSRSAGESEEKAPRPSRILIGESWRRSLPGRIFAGSKREKKFDESFG